MTTFCIAFSESYLSTISTHRSESRGKRTRPKRSGFKKGCVLRTTLVVNGSSEWDAPEGHPGHRVRKQSLVHLFEVELCETIF
jgi:hypothetical protein